MEPIRGWLLWECIPEISSQAESCSFASGAPAAVGETWTCFLWFMVHLYSVLTPLGCLLLSQWRGLGSGSHIRVSSLFPTDHVTVSAVWAVFVSMDDPGTSLMHFLSSPLPSACHEHQISSLGGNPLLFLSSCLQCQCDVLSASTALLTQLPSPSVSGVRSVLRALSPTCQLQKQMLLPRRPF